MLECMLKVQQENKIEMSQKQKITKTDGTLKMLKH